jgi:hypothetical protein
MMTDSFSLIINWLILAFVFLAGFIVGATVVIGKVMRHARHLYAPKQPEKPYEILFKDKPVRNFTSLVFMSEKRIDEIGFDDARREAIEKIAKWN